MKYPYTKLANILQFSCSPKEYQRLIAKYAKSTGRLRGANVGEDYDAILPLYTRAVCPFCQAQLKSPMDTYSLLGRGESDTILYSELRKESKLVNACSHFMATRQFLNLHGVPPTELTYMHSWTGEIPFISAWCLPDDIESYVVLHAIPVCRIIDNKFVPSYTRFMIHYFSMDREQIVDRRFKFVWAPGKNDPEFRASVFYAPGPNPEEGAQYVYDLQWWSNEGKLGYLDFTDPELSLKMGGDSVLPPIYQNIQGEKRQYTWKKGEIVYPLSIGRSS